MHARTDLYFISPITLTQITIINHYVFKVNRGNFRSRYIYFLNWQLMRATLYKTDAVVSNYPFDHSRNFLLDIIKQSYSFKKNLSSHNLSSTDSLKGSRNMSTNSSYDAKGLAAFSFIVEWQI